MKETKNNLLTNLQEPSFLLRYFLLCVFLSAAVYRVFNFDEAITEMTAINLPASFAYLSTTTEFLIVLMLLSRKTVVPALLLALSFLCFAISSAIVSNFQQAIADFWQLFTFQNESTDIALHCTFVIIIIVTLLMYRKS